MGTELLDPYIIKNYLVKEWKHACAILKSDFPNEWKDITDLLKTFKLKKSMINTPGGRKSLVSSSIDEFFYKRDWVEKHFETKITIDNNSIDSPTHKVDCYKNKVGLEIEWNNKDPFFDRDLNNFRLLFELRVISIGVIITRADELQDIFDELGRGDSYGSSTTHWGKLIPKIEGGGGAGCPILVFGITKQLYDKDN
jgi:hypothetical protein